MLKTQASKSNNSFAVFVVICIVIGASVSGIIIYNNRPIEEPNGTTYGIQDGDTILFGYELYVDGDYDDEFTNSELAIEEISVQWTVEENSEHDFPPGFYYNILGMVKDQIKVFIIPANIDGNHDGIDDITQIPVWDNGLSVYNLKFIVEILDIL